MENSLVNLLTGRDLRHQDLHLLREVDRRVEERITSPDLGLGRGLKENFVNAELKPHNSLPNLATPIFFVVLG